MQSTQNIKGKKVDWGSNIYQMSWNVTAQKMKFSIEDFFSKCDQIRSFQRIWSHLLKKSLMENFIFHAVCMSLNAALRILKVINRRRVRYSSVLKSRLISIQFF